MCSSAAAPRPIAPRQPPTRPPSADSPPPPPVQEPTSVDDDAPTPFAKEDGVEVYFSPNGGCQAAILQEVAGALRSVDVQAYSLTNAPIAAAIANAHKRGVKVRVVLDKSQQTEKHTSVTYLHNAGVEVRIDRSHGIAHNNVIIVDGLNVITGSYNFSKAAEESNAENLVIIRVKTEIADAYLKNFEDHLEHATKYEPPAPTK